MVSHESEKTSLLRYVSHRSARFSAEREVLPAEDMHRSYLWKILIFTLQVIFMQSALRIICLLL